MVKIFDIRFLRFLLVGFFNTLFGYGCYAGLLFVGVHYALASFVATVLGVLLNFKTVGYFVFSSSGNSRLLRFAMVYVAVYLINVMGLKVFSNIGIDLYYAGVILILPMAVLAYFLNKIYVFKNG